MSTLAVALTGNPNVGKSTIFNELTGARQKIGNWPGVTVDKKVGYTRHKDRAISIVDLPGTYSINARSPEEKIVIDYLLNNKLDLVVDVVDSSNLERNLFLTIQLLEQGIPLLIDLNMQDDAERNQEQIFIPERHIDAQRDQKTFDSFHPGPPFPLISSYQPLQQRSFLPDLAVAVIQDILNFIIIDSFHDRTV